MTTDNQPIMTTEPMPTSFGMRLRNARQARHLDFSDVTAQLRLNKKIILMLEEENYSSDVPTTFIRGYLRVYAKFLDIPIEEVTSALEQIQFQPTMPTTPLTTTATPQAITSKHYFIQLFTYLIVFTMLALVGEWWYSHTKSESSVSNVTTPLPLATNDISALNPVMVQATTSALANTTNNKTLAIAPVQLAKAKSSSVATLKKDEEDDDDDDTD